MNRHHSLVLVYALCAGCMGNYPGTSSPAPGSETAQADSMGASQGLHRLNHAEYNNTVRDLLSTQQTPADQFEPDGVAGGFDNVASALTIDLPLVQQYKAAADALAAEAVNPNTAAFKTVAQCDLKAGSGVSPGCLVTDLTLLARRAWRRPVTSAEIAALVSMAQVGQTPSDELMLGISAILVAPYFIFRIEVDANPNSTTPHPLTDYELASRLSYFVWSSMPDDDLLAAADSNTLHQPTVLNAQLQRMLASPKAMALVQNFGGQWLNQRAAAAAAPDPNFYTQFGPAIQAGMLAETSTYLQDFLLSDAPMESMLTSQYTYVNNTMAAYYGWTSPDNANFVKTPLPASTKRMGLLTQGSLLIAGAHSNVTSPVLRGRFVLQNLLCSSPPPAPATVNTSLPNNPNGTLRQTLEAHLTNPACVACHATMDPIGFSLEEFSGAGQFRTTDNGFPVDTTGKLPNGETFQDAPGMAALVASSPLFRPCAERMMYTYALGRVPDTTDTAALQSIGQQVNSGNGSFASLISSIVNSAAFTQRRGTP